MLETLLKHKKNFLFLLLSIMISFIVIDFVLFEDRYVSENPGGKGSYIKYVEFKVPYSALEKAYKLDVDSHNKNEKIKFNWVEILACLAAKKGGNFSNYKEADIDIITQELEKGKTITEITDKLKFYSYFLKAYNAVLGGFIGEYSIENANNEFEKRYGLKVFSPIAKQFPFEHYNDFGASRSYGYARPHLGHDLMAATGTPVVAVESGVVEAMGWNQYGGWRIGIRSFDRMRYYYYAHLRKDKPYHPDIFENKIVKAGDVIGYVGRTGYSPNENVNNISKSHLHLGLELVFDESQKESTNEIWIDLYNITKFLQKHGSEVVRNPEDRHYYRKYDFSEPALSK